MVKPQRLFSSILITLLPFLLVSSIATVNCRPTTLNRRVLSANCDPLFGVLCNDQWPYSPITSSNKPFISRPLLRHPSPPVVPLPPPMITNPSFSPLVASPPPPHNDFLTSPPFDALSFSPPDVGNPRPPETILPPPVDANPPPQQNFPAPDLFNVPAPPLVPVDSDQPQDDTQSPQDLPFAFTPATDPSTIGQPEVVTMPPLVDENGKTEPQLPPMVASPPYA